MSFDSQAWWLPALCRGSEVFLQVAAAACALAFVAHTARDWGIIAGTWARPARSMAVTVTFTAISVMLLVHLAILMVFATTQGRGWQVGQTCWCTSPTLCCCNHPRLRLGR